MGAHQSKEFDHNKQSGLFIRTDKPFYFSGEEVQGNIYLNVEGGSFPSSTIYLKVKGSEKAKWSEKRTVWETITGTNPPQRKSKQIVDHYDNKNEFYQHRIPLYLQLRDNPIRLIQISIQIPIEGEFTRIILIHFLLRSGMQHKIQQLEKIHYKQEFLVREPIKEAITSGESQKVLNLKSCFCLSMGTIFFKFEVDKNAYSPNEVAKFLVDIDNSQSKINIPTISGSLSNTLIVVSKQGYQKIIKRNIGTTMVQGVRSGEKAVGEFQKNMSLKLIDQEQIKELEPTTNGKIVMNNYTLYGSVELDGTCLCDSNQLLLNFQSGLQLNHCLVMNNLQWLLHLDGILKLCLLSKFNSMILIDINQPQEVFSTCLKFESIALQRMKY